MPNRHPELNSGQGSIPYSLVVEIADQVRNDASV